MKNDRGGLILPLFLPLIHKDAIEQLPSYRSVFSLFLLFPLWPRVQSRNTEHILFVQTRALSGSILKEMKRHIWRTFFLKKAGGKKTEDNGACGHQTEGRYGRIARVCGESGRWGLSKPLPKITQPLHMRAHSKRDTRAYTESSSGTATCGTYKPKLEPEVHLSLAT